jgi:hypothetical protein
VVRVIPVLAGEQNETGKLCVPEFAMTAFATLNPNKSGRFQFRNELTNLSWHTPNLPDCVAPFQCAFNFLSLLFTLARVDLNLCSGTVAVPNGRAIFQDQKTSGRGAISLGGRACVVANPFFQASKVRSFLGARLAKLR